MYIDTHLNLENRYDHFFGSNNLNNNIMYYIYNEETNSHFSNGTIYLINKDSNGNMFTITDKGWEFKLNNNDLNTFFEKYNN